MLVFLGGGVQHFGDHAGALTIEFGFSQNREHFDLRRAKLPIWRMRPGMTVGCQNQGHRGSDHLLSEWLPARSVSGKKPTVHEEFGDEAFASSWVEFHSQHELVMDWHVRNQREAGLQYPFVCEPYPESEAPYFYVRLIVGTAYFYWSGENVMPVGKLAFGVPGNIHWAGFQKV